MRYVEGSGRAGTDGVVALVDGPAVGGGFGFDAGLRLKANLGFDVEVVRIWSSIPSSPAICWNASM